MDYKNEFIRLSLSLCGEQDYKDSIKLKNHNIAMKKMGKLKAEMLRSGETELLRELLFHNDERVQLNAASACLGLFPGEAGATLKRLMDSASDPTIAFSAEILLKNSL